MTDDEIIERVKNALGHLNDAMRSANDAGLSVRVDQVEVGVVGKRHPLVFARVAIKRFTTEIDVTL